MSRFYLFEMLTFSALSACGGGGCPFRSAGKGVRQLRLIL